MNASMLAPCAAHSISQQAEASIGEEETGRCRGHSEAVLTSSRHPTPGTQAASGRCFLPPPCLLVC